MRGKIMQVTNKIINTKEHRLKFTLKEVVSDLTAYTAQMKDITGQSYTTIADGDYLGYQTINTIKANQQHIHDTLKSYEDAISAYILSKGLSVSTTWNRNYNPIPTKAEGDDIDQVLLDNIVNNEVNFYSRMKDIYTSNNSGRLAQVRDAVVAKMQEAVTAQITTYDSGETNNASIPDYPSYVNLFKNLAGYTSTPETFDPPDNIYNVSVLTRHVADNATQNLNFTPTATWTSNHLHWGNDWFARESTVGVQMNSSANATVNGIYLYNNPEFLVSAWKDSNTAWLSGLNIYAKITANIYPVSAYNTMIATIATMNTGTLTLDKIETAYP